jgi:hypothetical protein
MKKRKIVLVFFLLTSLLQVSCATSEVETKELLSKHDRESETGIYEDLQYVINGKTLTTLKEKQDGIKDAFHVHFDFPNNRAVVSRTEQDLEQYLKSNSEFSSYYNKPILPEPDESVSKTTKTAEITGTWALPNGVRHTQLNLHHKLYFMFQWRSATTTAVRHFIGNTGYQPNLNNGIPTNQMVTGNGSNMDDFQTSLNLVNYYQNFPASQRSFMLRNSNRSISQSVTFESRYLGECNACYGQSATYSLGKNRHRYILIGFVPKLMKI